MSDPRTRLAFAIYGATIGVATTFALSAVSAKSRVEPKPSGHAQDGAQKPLGPSREEPVVPPGVRAKLLSSSAGARTYQLVLAPGTEAMAAIGAFVTANHVEAAHFEGLGACTDAVLAYWDPDIRDYRKTQYRQQMEIVSILGEAAPTQGDGPGLHAHMALAFADGTMHGGHLFETHVSPTMELVLTASPNAVHRHFDETFHGWLLDP